MTSQIKMVLLVLVYDATRYDIRVTCKSPVGELYTLDEPLKYERRGNTILLYSTSEEPISVPIDERVTTDESIFKPTSMSVSVLTGEHAKCLLDGIKSLTVNSGVKIKNKNIRIKADKLTVKTLQVAAEIGNYVSEGGIGQLTITEEVPTTGSTDVNSLKKLFSTVDDLTCSSYMYYTVRHFRDSYRRLAFTDVNVPRELTPTEVLEVLAPISTHIPLKASKEVAIHCGKELNPWSTLRAPKVTFKDLYERLGPLNLMDVAEETSTVAYHSQIEGKRLEIEVNLTKI